MDVCDSLIKWVQTFPVEEPVHSADDLVDGVVISQILHQISPTHFSDLWLSKIKVGATTDWRLKVSNLKKVQKGIVDFYSVFLHQQLSDTHMPDITALAERGDKQELGRMLQLVLGCAVNCDDKHEYIRRIMNMEEAVQHDVMKAIQELMTRESTSSVSEAASSDSDDQVRKLMDELQKMSDEKDEYAQRCHDLDLQVVLLQEAKGNLLAEVERLNDRLNQNEALDDPNSMAGRRYVQLQKQVEQLQEELYRSETGRDDYRIKAELLQKELSELQEKSEELEMMAKETSHLRDEVDILRHTAEKVSKYEASVASYKKKLEEMSNLKGEMKLLEEKNMSYIQKTLDLEEEVKKSGVLKTQLEAYKRQVQDLQLKSTDETKRADKAEFEAKRHEEKAAVLALDKERLLEERNSLKEMVEEMRCTQIETPVSGISDDADGDSSSLDFMSLPSHIRERMVRLQHENQLLKMQSSSDENSQLLRSMLDDANTHKHELECQVRSLNRRVVELEANVNDLTELQQRMSSDEDAVSTEARKRLTEQLERSQKLESSLQKTQQQVEELEAKLQVSVDEADTLRSLLTKKEAEMKETEEKYKKYLEKARTILRQMDSKNNPSLASVPPELSVLKSQLSEKEKFIQQLEQEHEQMKQSRDTEEKLMVTAWYNLGMAVHRRVVDDRLSVHNSSSSSSSTSQHSFLTRQRMAHIRRQPGANISPAQIPQSSGPR